jgi:hypothetical protein
MQYTVQRGDSFPSIAAAFGHPGEWRAIAELNPSVPDPGMPFAGMELELPDEWGEASTEAAPAVAEGSSLEARYGGENLSAGELVELARDAHSIADLDWIEDQAAGRVTVQTAVATRRQELERSGIAS